MNIRNKYQYILSTAAETETLTINPAGWNNLGIVYERNEFYHGCLRNYVLSLRFAKKSGGGGDFIKRQYDASGLEAVVNISIKKRSPQTDDFETLYSGIFDYQRYEESRDYVEIGIIDSNKEHKFKSRENLNYNINTLVSTDNININAFVNEPRNITFKAIDIQLICNSDGLFSVNGAFTAIDTETGYYAATINSNEIGARVKMAASPSNAKIYENDTGQTVNIVGNIAGTYGIVYQAIPTASTNNVTMRFFSVINVRSAVGALISQNVVIPAVEVIYTNIGSTQNYSLIGSYNVDLNLEMLDGYDLEFTTIVIANSLSNINLSYTTNNQVSDFDLYEISLGETESTAVCYLPFEVATRLIQLMTSETDTAKLFDSELLGRTDSEYTTYATNGDASLDAITTGWNIRKFPSKAIITNFRDFFKSIDAIYNVGLGFDRDNDRFYLEKKEEFYKNELMFDLGEVEDLKVTPGKYYSKILSGYNYDGRYEDYQGAYEFCLKSEHSMRIPVQDELDLRSVYRADSIGMEIARRLQYSEAASEDTDHDESIFIVRTDGSETLQAGTSVTGFGSVEDYYNIAITPRENLIRWANFLKSVLWKSQTAVKFNSNQKDIDISYTNQNGNAVDEQDDLGIDLEDDRLYNADIYEFTAPITLAIIEQLNSDPHGYITFENDGTDYEGYLINVETGDYDRKARWKLQARNVTGEGDNYQFEDSINYDFENSVNYEFE